MNSSASPSEKKANARRVLVTAETRRVPLSVPLMNQCQYVERLVHRLLAAWGRRMSDWDGKTAIHRHMWDQAEIIRRLRERIAQFSGGKPDAAVGMPFEKLADTALFAPSFEDALDGIYKVTLKELLKIYVEWVQYSHPVHDAPSLALFHEINTIKEQHFFWYRSYRRQNPHTTDPAYLKKLKAGFADVKNMRVVVPVQGAGTVVPCRPDNRFQLPKVSSRPESWAAEVDLYPYFSADFADNIESRRLFWAIAYLQEMSLPDDQLAWIYFGDYMPWEWHHTISRHLWDESRHACSGYSRLQDWGISLADVGFHVGADHLLRHPGDAPLAERMVRPFIDEADRDFDIPMKPITPAAMYETVFNTGMVLETGHFIVKNEGFSDFQAADDLESAEMMLFDIIDETAHVQYAHRWLPLLAEHAGADNSDYKQRALDKRKERQENEMDFIKEAQALPRNDSFAPWRHYQNLLAKVRNACPIANTKKFANRSVKPM